MQPPSEGESANSQAGLQRALMGDGGGGGDGCMDGGEGTEKSFLSLVVPFTLRLPIRYHGLSRQRQDMHSPQDFCILNFYDMHVLSCLNSP